MRAKVLIRQLSLLQVSLHPKEKEEVMRSRWQNMIGPSYFALVNDALHGFFSDQFLFIPWSGEPPLKLDPLRAIEITRALLVAFFDKFLKNQHVSIEKISVTYPEVNIKSK